MVVTKMTVLAIANQKGGVGKTTCCINLAAALGERGHSILVVDMDPQGNCTSGFGINPLEISESVYDVLLGEKKAEEVLHSLPWKGVTLLPATLDLAGAEVELAGAMSRENRLKKKMAEMSQHFSLVLIDCPPSLGLLTINALVAADEVLVPLQCEFFAMQGISQLTRTMKLVQGYLNEDLRMGGIILTMFDGRTNLSKEVEAEIRKSYGAKVFRTVVPRNIRLSEAPSHGMPVRYYEPSCPGAQAYDDLAEEVIARWLEKEH